MTSRPATFHTSRNPEGVSAVITETKGNLCSIKVGDAIYHDIPLFPLDGPPSEGSYVRAAPEIASVSAKPGAAKPAAKPAKTEE